MLPSSATIATKTKKRLKPKCMPRFTLTNYPCAAQGRCTFEPTCFAGGETHRSTMSAQIMTLLLFDAVDGKRVALELGSYRDILASAGENLVLVGDLVNLPGRS